ncbi:MAG: ABC transporter substrate-binding protein [Acutalibacteraceae bacterium]|nr:ABC transporter substrate-binding protein [Clostridia bacterium]MEE1330443.1 ABC transporter substrate-binding protein [Acutalibacteraceae bacterium]
MKKIISVITALSITAALCISLSGCGEKKTNYKVGICQLVQHDALDAATKGFKDALTEKLGDKVTFDEQNAAGEPATCTTIVNQFVSSKVDLIFANATGALQAAVSATDSIPIVGTSITDYATALEMSDWNGKTGINVTGTSDLAPLEDQAKMIKELIPNVKTVGILYCSGEANSKYQATEVAKYLKEMGIESREFTSADSNDLAQVVTSACAAVDAIYIPTDNTMASSTEIINNIAEPAKVPIIAGEEGICKGCGIATLSIDYYSLGKKAGEMAYDILVNGKDPADMEIGFASDLTKKYVKTRCEALGITVPSDYEEIQ